MSGVTALVLQESVDIIIDDDHPDLDYLLTSFADILKVTPSTTTPASTPASANGPRPTIRIRHAPRLTNRGMRQIGQGILIGERSLYDRRYQVRLESPAPNVLQLTSTDSCLEWLMWVIQLSLLKVNKSFVHSAGVAHNGRALLFPSWGGVGKTAIVEGFVNHMGWRLLGDDLVLLTKEGECLAFPKPMVLYPYHRSIFPHVFAAGKGPIAPTRMNSLLTRAGVAVKPLLRAIPGALSIARRYNPQSVRVRPSDVFGDASIAPSSTLSRAIWLERLAGLSDPKLMRSDGTLASRIVGSTLLELDQWCARLVYVACGVGMLSFREIFPAWLDTVESGLRGAEQWILYLPADLPVEEVAGVVQRVLAQHGIIDGGM